MLCASFAEMLSIGAILPFLGVLTAPEVVFEYSILQPLIEFLELTEPEQLLVPLTALFCSAVLLAGAVRMFLLWANTRLSFATGADLSISIYNRALHQPYSVHIASNSSELISGISEKTNRVTSGVMLPLLNLISGSVMLTTILVTLLVIDTTMAILAGFGFGIIYGLVIRYTRYRLLSNSKNISKESTQVIKSIQEGLGGIRDVLIGGFQGVYLNNYKGAVTILRRAQSNNAFISGSPRFAMEALGMVFIAGLALSMASRDAGISRAIPVLGVLALAVQRLLPVVQQLFSAWSTIQGSRGSLEDALLLLEKELPAYANKPMDNSLVFNAEINLRNISFRYSTTGPLVLKNINLRIKKGSRVGFVGVTGSGKSTLLDIIMGLLVPTSGALEIDQVTIDVSNQQAWQSHIAHVPQSIFLADTTITQNIAFGIPEAEISFENVKKAAEQAQISAAIEGLPSGYESLVGERGVRLSGGQRQRIGIARALYKKADVMIFDEATSALDNETEQELMQAIECLSNDITVLIIAHRLTTLKNCTQIVEIKDTRIERTGSYSEIVNKFV